jgi:hypothetical protein
VSDRLRCVVLVFDRNLRFQTEFGYRGAQPSNLIVPDDLAVDSNGNVYIGQAANRGVSVFQVVRQEASPPQAGEATSRKQARRTTSRNSERSGRIIEADESDRLEFVVDHGSDTGSTDSEGSGWKLEEVESHQNEVKENE